MKAATRAFLIGAPAVVLVGAAVGIATRPDPVLADHPPSYAQQDRAGGAASATAGAQEREDARRAARMPAGLAAPAEREIAAKLLSSAENSTLDWRGQYGAIQDVGDGNGYTAGVVGFCSGTGDMLQLVTYFTRSHPDNPLAAYLPALRRVDGSGSHQGLDPGFRAAWRQAAATPAFRAAQDTLRDRLYFDPAVRLAKADGLSTLGQFIYYDAMVLNGPGEGADTFYGIRDAALRASRTPSRGGDETAYLGAFLDADRSVIVRKPLPSQRDTSRIDTAQRVFLDDGNLALRPPLTWRMYGEPFHIAAPDGATAGTGAR